STSRKSAGEAMGVAELGRDLEPDEGVLIFPEGALYTPQRREHLLARMRERGEHDLYERACRIKYMLPPRTGGVLSLLDAAPNADVLFIGTHGLEGATKYTSIAFGALVNARLRVRFWRVPAAEIPPGKEAR